MGNLILQILRKVQIHETKLPLSYQFYIDNNGKVSIFTKSSATKLAIIFNLKKKKKTKKEKQLNLLYSLQFFRNGSKGKSLKCGGGKTTLSMRLPFNRAAVRFNA